MVFTDQLGRTITLEKTPERIISLVPSQTELLYDIGLRYEVVGITKFCIHPEEWFRTKTRVGGTKKLDIEVIHSLKPDLIIGNKEENYKNQIDELAKEYPVWMSTIKTFADAKKMILSVGEMTGKYFESIRLLKQIDEKFDVFASNLKLQTLNHKSVSVAYFIWNNPIMVAGGDTYISNMLSMSGFKNIFAEKERYPAIEAVIINDLKPDYVFLSTEPFPFKEKHLGQYQKLFPFSKAILVDGEMFSWYGSRMLKAPDYFQQLVKLIF